MSRRLALSALALVLGGCDRAAGPAPEPKGGEKSVAAAPAPSPTIEPDYVLRCDWPVDGNKDTAKTVLARFGKDAQRATLNGPEGMQIQGIVLWNDDPRRRIELILDDESPHERIFGATVDSEQSQWRIAGVGIGDPLDRVAKANAGPITFWGFGWDYGGYVTDFGGGALADPAGGCEAAMRLDSGEGGIEPESGLLGEVQVKSNDPRIAKLGVKVSELGLNWR